MDTPAETQRKMAAFLWLKRHERARELRRDVSMAEFAMWLGVPPTSYGPWENGYRLMGIEYWAQLSQKLGAGFDEILQISVVSDPDLRAIVNAWPGLTEDERATIKALAARARGGDNNAAAEIRKLTGAVAG